MVYCRVSATPPTARSALALFPLAPATQVCRCPTVPIVARSWRAKLLRMPAASEVTPVWRCRIRDGDMRDNCRSNSMEHKSELTRFTVTSDQDNPHQHTLVDHRVRSEYVEDNWLPFIGPVALILARRLDSRLGYEQRVAVETARWCEAIGIEP